MMCHLRDIDLFISKIASIATKNVIALTNNGFKEENKQKKTEVTKLNSSNIPGIASSG